jgi:aminopeptidase N
VRRWILGLAAGAIASVVVVGLFIVLRRPPDPPPPPEAGIPLALAEDRAARVSDLEYRLSLRVPAARAEPVRGQLTASFNLSQPGRPLAFDFSQPPERLLAVSANGQPLTPSLVNGHVAIPADRLTGGANTVEFEFLAGDEALNRQDEYLYSLFVPARASIAMPVMDQPDLKARWTLSLTVPPGWVAVSNGRETGTMKAADRVGYLFETTQPISTYLFAFAAGRFEIETAARGNRAFRMFHRETDAAKVARNRDAVFDLHAHALDWLEAFTGIPYPFGKFDFVLIPSFQFGGMEHPGSIFYNANSLFLDEAATQNQRLGRASLIAHETSHMWFGDLVTMRWFNDVWMKEVFANFMAAKIVNPSFPDVNHELRFFLQHYPAAYDVDRTAGANPIRQPLANLNEAGSLYGAIIYQKAPIVMRQLEMLIGDATMRDGLREYLKTYSFRNATWPDLIRMLDARTPRDLEAWSRAWVDERARPTIHVDVITGNGGRHVELRQEDPLGRGLVWPQAFEVIYGYPDGTARARVELDQARGRVPAPSAAEPARADDWTWVLPTGGGIGYGDFVLDAPLLERLAAALPDVTDPLTRGAMLVTLWESMLEARVPPSRIADVLLTALPREQDELLIQAMLDASRLLYWRFTRPADRPALAARLELEMRASLDVAPTTSRKAAWFSALRSVASSRETLQWLEQVWRRQVKIPNLPLAETDEIELAQDLAVRDVPGADAILRAQHERIENPDRKARFAFVMPALSGDPGVRAQFFESLKDVNNRRREAWVLDAARYLHHPLRAEQSKHHVIPALQLVHEIQRTGDIFFPKRWADATLSGYQSADVAAEVRAFIDALPAEYPPRLRWVLLASADPLFKAARQTQ